MKRLPVLGILFASFLVFGAMTYQPQVVPAICGVFFDRRSGEVDVLYGISCPAEIDSTSAAQMRHQGAVIPIWCDVFGVLSAPGQPLIKAHCEKPPQS